MNGRKLSSPEAGSIPSMKFAVFSFDRLYIIEKNQIWCIISPVNVWFMDRSLQNWQVFTRIVNSVTGMGYVFTKNNLLTFFIKPFVIFFYKIALTNSRVIFQNQQDMDYFIGHHLVKASQCALIPSSGVDIEKFHPTPY